MIDHSPPTAPSGQRRTRLGVWRRLPIKFKLFTLLTALPLFSLTLYLSLAARLFKEDKLAYVRDSGAEIAKSLAAEVSVETLLAQSTVRPWIESYNVNAGGFDPTTVRNFQSNDRLAALFVVNPGDRSILKRSMLTRNDRLPESQLDPLCALAIRWANLPPQGAPLIAVWSNGYHKYGLLGSIVSGAPSRSGWFVLSVFRASRIEALFRDSGAYENFLVDKEGKPLFGPLLPRPEFLGALHETVQSYGSQAIRAISSMDDRSNLASAARVPGTELFVVSVISRKDALRAVRILLAKSVAFFGILISLTVLLSILASRALTSAITRLHAATRKVAQGHFDIQVQVGSEDEIGDLARSFNEMALQVARLIDEQLEKGRMEKELETARVVQETLFPEPVARIGPLELAGACETASECGGDWWHYGRIHDRTLLWFGDVMGHGASSALITAATRSFAAVMECLGNGAGFRPGPAELLVLLNRAIFQTSKGQMSMTLFLACFDPAHDVLLWSNASQPLPRLYRNQTEVPDGLAGGRGDVLGIAENPEFRENTIHLQPGDLLIFYTDGVTDAASPDGSRLGRKRMKELFSLAVQGGKTTSEIRDRILRSLAEFRQGSRSDDDITVVVCRYHGQPETVPLLKN